jgi:hypothetical protein
MDIILWCLCILGNSQSQHCTTFNIFYYIYGHLAVHLNCNIICFNLILCQITLVFYHDHVRINLLSFILCFNLSLILSYLMF